MLLFRQTEKNLKSPPQYSSHHNFPVYQTTRQMRTQNAFVSSSNNNVSNNCDSNNSNEITTTVTSQTGIPATTESTEGKKRRKKKKEFYFNEMYFPFNCKQQPSQVQ